MSAIPGLSHNTSLLIYTLIAVIGLVVLIAKFKLNSFVALMLASLFVGLCSGMKWSEIPKAFERGFGDVMGSIAVVIALGTMLGKMLAESGGAERIATTLVDLLGEKWIHWTMMVVAFIVGIPVFFSVGLVLLVPIVFTLAKQTKTPLLFLAIPLVAGLSVVHGLAPPHPGPMAALGVFNAQVGMTDVGKTIFYALLVGLPTAIIGGPIFGKLISRRVHVELGGGFAEQLTATRSTLTAEAPRKNPPGFALTVFTILLPVLLMMTATVVDLSFDQGNRFRAWIDFIGSPMVAMLIALLFSFYSFGFARGFGKQQLAEFTTNCLAPLAMIFLVVGAGGGFSRVLVASGVGEAIAALAKHSPLSPLLLGWLVAALIRVATGSATVAITTAAGIIAPIAKSAVGLNLELLIVAMGAGSLILSHVNDGGFWLVKEYFNMTVPQTLKTWTVMETINSVVAMALVLVLDALI